MTPIASAWLPETAFTPTAIDAVLGDLFASWSEHWFDGRITVGAVRPSLAGHHLPQITQIDVTGCRSSATVSGRAKRSLLEKLLGLGLQGCSLSEKDHRLLDALAKNAMEDLIAHSDAWSENHGISNDSENQLTLVLCVDGAEILHLQLHRSALAAAVRIRSAKSSMSSSRTESRDVALAKTPLTVNAVLGVGKVSFADLSELAVGDVVLLDRPIDGAIDLTLAINGGILATGSLGRDDARVTLKLN